MLELSTSYIWGFCWEVPWVHEKCSVTVPVDLWLANTSGLSSRPHPFCSLAAATWMCAISTCSSSFPSIVGVSWAWLALRLLWLPVSSSHWGLCCTASTPPRGNVIKVFQSKCSLCFSIAAQVLCCSHASNNRSYDVRHLENGSGNGLLRRRSKWKFKSWLLSCISSNPNSSSLI